MNEIDSTYLLWNQGPKGDSNICKGTSLFLPQVWGDWQDTGSDDMVTWDNNEAPCEIENSEGPGVSHYTAVCRIQIRWTDPDLRLTAPGLSRSLNKHLNTSASWERECMHAEFLHASFQGGMQKLCMHAFCLSQCQHSLSFSLLSVDAAPHFTNKRGAAASTSRRLTRQIFTD